MGRRPRTRRSRSPRDARVRTGGLPIYFTLPRWRLSALRPVHPRPATTSRFSASPERGRILGRPDPRRRRADRPRLFQGPAELYVGRSPRRSSDRHERRQSSGLAPGHSMGIHRQVPDRLRQLHPKYGTPWIGIVLFGFIACLTLLPGQAEFLGYMYAFGAMLSFTIAHAAVIRLRSSAPDRERPYRGPGNIRIRGLELPGFALFAGRRRCCRSRSSPRCTRTWRSPARSGWRSASASTRSTAAGRAGPTRR